MPLRYWLALIGALALAFAIVAATYAHAGEDIGTWFKSLTIPGNGGSCCDVADCHPTESEFRDGGWWAIVGGKWRAIPPSRVLPRVSILDQAVVCSSSPAPYYDSGHPGEPTIYCFVPPLMGL